MLISNRAKQADDAPRTNDERKTVELCGDERGGRRCIRPHGHDGQHECHTATTVHVWK
jgi:hypothetical protein